MEKQKRWQFYLIIAVMVLTLYNILPTVFYYTKPLKDPIGPQKAETVAAEIVDRINSLEERSKEWLYSFAKLLGLQTESIELNKDNPQLYEVTFRNSRDAALFARFLPNAGSVIPFVPAQLGLGTPGPASDPNKVVVMRQIAVHLDPAEINNLFIFSRKRNDEGGVEKLYQEIVYDRAEQVALALGGPSHQALQMQLLAQNADSDKYDDMAIEIAQSIVDIDTTFKKYPEIVKRYFSNLTQNNAGDGDKQIEKFATSLQSVKKRLNSKKEALVNEQETLVKQGLQLEAMQGQQLFMLQKQAASVDSAIAIIKKNQKDFAGKKALTAQQISKELNESGKNISRSSPVQRINLQGTNPFVEGLDIDWNSDKIFVRLYPDVQKLRALETTSNDEAIVKEKLSQYLINEIALASQASDENLEPNDTTFAIALNNLNGSESFLAFNLGYVAEKRAQEIVEQLKQIWKPTHPDLANDVFPIYSYDEFKKQNAEDQRFGLVVYAPAGGNEGFNSNLRPGSIYVVAKGLDSIVQKYKDMPDAPDASSLEADFTRLVNMLRKDGFIAYSGASYGMAPEFSKDFIFELAHYYDNLIDASRENFYVKGSKSYAVLDFTDVEQRILALNKIDDRIQEDLLKWREAYSSSLVDLDVSNRYKVPAPTQNAYLANMKLDLKKYFRGDDRKILKWGLDLSGGKTVRIGLRDRNNQPVTNPDDLKQAVNELYVRVNKMGVSERTIHVENDNIILDFPGSQALSAAELIRASAMYFHIVNEKFGNQNPALRGPVNQFLQEIWNEAVVTNRKDIESINEIAWRHLGGDSSTDELTNPRSESASILYENGLRLPNPKTTAFSHAFNDTLSTVGMMRGDNFREWEGQAHPLVFLFHNYALEGSSLTNINAGYDPMKGNTLTFAVKSSYEGHQGGSPQEDFSGWTAQFAADKIAGTPKEQYSQGHGWRMAVLLNGTIISMPRLEAALKDGGTITGRFSQREVNQLAADLKAGSLSFTPKILSEQNVSPELGAEERVSGLIASLIAVSLVVIVMVSYYRFAGVVASVALLFNFLIMWGILQNLGAALSLPTIAGIVLTLGMAVDANVLVFERIREEFALSGRIASAVQAGYRKAFSAIVDSNITTIIAALILIQFDSGPIKGFAVALIVGIVSSMFTSLFMTRYFFAGWVQNPANKSLPMSQFFELTHFDFLGQTRKAVIITCALLALGSVFFYVERHTIFGMDFTGGYALNVDVQEQPGNPNYRVEVANALMAAGASSDDIQIRELSKPNQLHVQLGMSIEEKGHPFYMMPEVVEVQAPIFDYQENPRLSWVVNALEAKDIKISKTQLESLKNNWTAMSGQFSESMRDNTIMALSLALLSVLVYITLRFEFKYAIGAVAGLVHDVLLTLGILAFFRWLGFAVQIDLQVIGAIMTIIGYSLNDTIIVFDRIREDIKLMRKLPFHAVVNHALNVTLSRTVMTSGTTLLVLFSLVFFGGKSIFAFSLVMAIGVLVGTFSSLFIASPIMIYFHDREVKAKEQEQRTLRKA